MKKHRLLAIVMAMMMVVAFGMTSMAASKSDTRRNSNVSGTVSYNGATASGATTSVQEEDKRVFACITAEYMTSSGRTYTSGTTSKNGIRTVSARKTVEGSVISAWSSHGIVSKEFTIYI